MKEKSINVQIVKNLGNYETIRIGGEWELNGEDLQDAIRAAVEELEAAYSKPKVEQKAQPQPQPQPQDTRKVVRFDHETKLLQSIINRVIKDDTVTMDVIDKYYILDDEARKAVTAAFKLGR